VVTITHGPKDPDRVMLALVTASKLPPGDNHVWFSIDGGQLCKKGEAEKVTSPLFTKQGNAAKMIEDLRARGVAVHI
jgi:predicted peroxiredoxin